MRGTYELKGEGVTARYRSLCNAYFNNCYLVTKSS